MDITETIALVGGILVPMLGGYAWILIRMDKGFHHLSQQIMDVDKRLSRLEGYIEGRESVLKVKGE